MVLPMLTKFINRKAYTKCIEIIIAMYKILNCHLFRHFPGARNCLLVYPYFLYKKFIEDQTGIIFNKIHSHLQNGCILDVGACLGYTAKCFANKDFSNRTVFAFESHPFNYQQLKKSRDLFLTLLQSMWRLALETVRYLYSKIKIVSLIIE